MIAGTAVQFQDYVRDKPLNGDKKYSYVPDADTLRGFVNPHGVLIGSWKQRKDIIEILNQLIISTTNDCSALIKIKTELIAERNP